FGTVKGRVDYALLVDGLAAEREQGITIDVAYRYFQTDRRRFILADTPGHEQYTRNMASGASNADIAILLVDARKGVLQQTRRHATVAAMFGISHFILAVNKMDLVGFDRAVYEEITEDFITFSENFGTVRTTSIPICARDGDNITARSAHMPWYMGPALLEALERAEPRDHGRSGPFRMHVQGVIRAGADFRGYTGTISSGSVRCGARITNVISRVSAQVERIVTMDGDLETGHAGDAVTLVLRPEIDISRGDVLSDSPLPQIGDRLAAQVMWFDDAPLIQGRDYLFMFRGRVVGGSVSDITHRLDIDTRGEIPARELRINEVGHVTISLAQPVVFEPYRLAPDLGSAIIIDRMTRNTVGAALIERADQASNLHAQHLDIDKHARAALKGQRPAVLWFTGLSGAGKSTVANLVEGRLHMLGRHTMMLDGDNVRQGLNRDLGFNEADRVENIRRIAEVAKLFVDAGLIVLVSFISPYRAERMLARERVQEGEFIEIHVDTPIEECRRRDPKGLYAKAYAGQIRNFTGVDAPYEEPEDPEIHLQTIGRAAEALAEQIIRELRVRGIID
ncbi:MAG: adenylyl-sulfate kinase, partial [Acetobacteraceae bacterium]|nr:adenylyl-sulfate kinase [Acetobacteraceae bacterium]